MQLLLENSMQRVHIIREFIENNGYKLFSEN